MKPSKPPGTGLIRNSTAELLILTGQVGEKSIEARYEDETVWLSQKLMATLFDVEVRTISEHLRNIFASGELEKGSVVRNFRTTASDGKTYNTSFYNLDAIISVGYRVNSKRATQFRQWATRVLKEFAVKGYVLDRKRLENGEFLGDSWERAGCSLAWVGDRLKRRCPGAHEGVGGRPVGGLGAPANNQREPDKAKAAPWLQAGSLLRPLVVAELRVTVAQRHAAVNGPRAPRAGGVPARRPLLVTSGGGPAPGRRAKDVGGLAGAWCSGARAPGVVRWDNPPKVKCGARPNENVMVRRSEFSMTCGGWGRTRAGSDRADNV